VFIILGIIAVINFISTHWFFRLDLTEEKQFTISKATKARLSKLDDLVNIKVYFSKKLPHYLMPLQHQVRDILQEYRAYSKGKIVVEYVDPTKDKETENRVRILGIPQLQLNIRAKDKLEVMNAYMGMGIFYADKKEIIPVVKDVGNLEYDLTTAIIKITAKEVKKVGFLTGHEEHNIYDDYDPVRRKLEQQYEVRVIDTSIGQRIPEDIHTLIVAGPKELKEWDKYQIDQFIMRGGKVIFLIDAVELQKDVVIATVREHNMDDILEHYGVRINKDLVADRVNSMASFRSGFVTYTVSYPLWPKIIKPNMSKDNPCVAGLESLTFPWVSSIDVLKRAGIKTEELVKTTEYAWVQKGRFDLNPQSLGMMMFSGTDKRQQYTLAAVLSGKFKSFYADKPVPKFQPEEDEDITPAGDISEEETIKESKKQTRIVVVSDSDFISDRHIHQFPTNMLFFLNIVDWLTLGDDLINIRSRGITDRPLKELSEREKGLYKTINIIGIPAIVVGFGLSRMVIRRRKIKSDII
jgi:gliding-associated putative ABC transporter substrate-binding component GldG